MTRLTSLDLTPFYRNTVGIDRLFDRMVNQIDHSTTSNYPPYNLIKIDNDNYQIELAVAGFEQGEITVNLHEGQLSISGEHANAENDSAEYLHRGISSKKFVRTFQLSDYMEVKDATMRNGVLTITCERIVPESMKPRGIAITYAN